MKFRGDLINWSNAILVGSTPNGDGGETLTWRDIIPLQNASARYARLAVHLN